MIVAEIESAVQRRVYLPVSKQFGEPGELDGRGGVDLQAGLVYEWPAIFMN